MFSRLAPIVGLAGIAVSLHGCGSDPTPGPSTTSASPTAANSTTSASPTAANSTTSASPTAANSTTSASPTAANSTTSASPTPLAPNEGTCRADTIAAGIKDCDRPDFGSCGNACCEITTVVDLSPEDVVNALNTSLADGGTDGRYVLQTLFQGSPHDIGFTNLDDGTFLGQVHHTTSGPGHYTDKVNFLVEPSGSTGNQATIKAFSLALTGGALGDTGQSFKNIIMALKGADFPNWDPTSVTNIGGSCPAPAGKIAVHAQDEGAEISERRRLDEVVGTCGLDSRVPDCDHADVGSCGNACCSLRVHVAMSASAAVALLNSSFATGGPDGQFTKNPLAEGGIGFANLTAMKPPLPITTGEIYIGQLNHTTTGGANHFIDVVNFNIVDNGEGVATINAFSTSLIGGAYGDSGQNYKNLLMTLSAFPSFAFIPGEFYDSCPAASSVLV